MASQITSVSIVCLTIYSGADQRKHQSSTSLAYVRGIPHTKGQGGVSLHLESSSDECSWYRIIGHGINIAYPGTHFVLEIRWRVRINDAETSSNFWRELYRRSANSPIHRMTGARASRPIRLSEPVDCYVNNLKNGVMLSYINDEIKIVAIQKSVLYNDDNLVIILSTFFSPENDRRKRLSRFCKRSLQYYEVRDLFPWEMPTKMMISCLLNVEKSETLHK